MPLTLEEIKIRHKECCRRYRLNHPEKIKLSQKKHFETHKEEKKAYREAHRPEHLEYCKKYNQEHKDAAKAYVKEHYWETKFKKQRSFVKSRHGGELARETIQRVYEDNIKKFGTLTCVYCKKPTAFGRDSLDHKIPVCRGGSHEYDNLVIACISCNSSKRHKTDSEFEQWLNKQGEENV